MPYADLVPLIEVSPAIGDVGRTIDIAWTVKNDPATATGVTPADSWSDEVWLTRDAVIGNGDDVRLAEIGHSGELQVGQSYTDAVTVAIPNTFIGSGHLFVVTDSNNQVFESQQENNNTTELAPIEVLAPDLQVEASLSTFAGVFGDTIPVDFVVRNDGTGGSYGDTRDRIWLSSNTTLGGDDLLLATVTAVQIPLAAGASYTRDNLLVNLPLNATLTAGDYYIIVETDVLRCAAGIERGK